MYLSFQHIQSINFSYNRWVNLKLLNRHSSLLCNLKVRIPHRRFEQTHFPFQMLGCSWRRGTCGNELLLTHTRRNNLYYGNSAKDTSKIGRLLTFRQSCHDRSYTNSLSFIYRVSKFIYAIQGKWFATKIAYDTRMIDMISGKPRFSLKLVI